MNTWQYKDTKQSKFIDGQWVAPVVLIVEANLLTEADKEFEKVMGKPPEKMSHISVSKTPS